MILYYQTHSPFARQVLVFAHEVGLAQTLDVIHQETSPTLRNEDVFSENPLGKVPVLIRNGKSPLFDSSVICAYLDTLHAGAPLIPPSGEARWEALKLEAVAHGIAEAGIAVRWESVRRPKELRYPLLRDGYSTKIRESLEWLERTLDAKASDINIGHVALATALSWLVFRDVADLSAHPNLAAWLERFEARPSMRATPLSGETKDG